MPDDRKAGKGRSLKKTGAAAGGPAVVAAKETRHVESPVGFLERGLPNPAVEEHAEYREPDACAEAFLADEWRRPQLRQNFLPKGGLALKAVYRRRVLCDEERRTRLAEGSVHEFMLDEMLDHEIPGVNWPFLKTCHYFRPKNQMWGYNLIPVYFEEWASPEQLEWAARGLWGALSDYVPDEVVFAWKRRQELIKGLIEKFREGELIGEGVCEYPESSMTLVREVILAAWWSRNEVEAAFDDNALFRSVRNEPEPVPFYSDIRVLPPEDGAAGHSDLPRIKPGRRSERPAIEKAWNDLSLDEQRALVQHPNVYIWDRIRELKFGRRGDVAGWSDKTLERYLGSLIAITRNTLNKRNKLD